MTITLITEFIENTEYLSVFSPNAGKYGPEKLRERTLFTQCIKRQLWFLDNLKLANRRFFISKEEQKPS